MRLVAIAEKLVQAHGSGVVIDNAQHHPASLVAPGAFFDGCDKPSTQSLSPVVFAHREVAKLPLAGLGGFGHRMAVRQGGDCGNDLVVFVGDYERFVESGCDVAQGLDVRALLWHVTAVEVGLDGEICDDTDIGWVRLAQSSVLGATHRATLGGMRVRMTSCVVWATLTRGSVGS